MTTRLRLLATRRLAVVLAAATALGLVVAVVGAHEDERHAGPEPTEAQIQKRFERVIAREHERQRDRLQRTQDRKRDLRVRLDRMLRGAEITEDIMAELRSHARRVAGLRRARFVAAEAKNFEAVREADRLLADERGQHERWWAELARRNRGDAK